MRRRTVPSLAPFVVGIAASAAPLAAASPATSATAAATATPVVTAVTAAAHELGQSYIFVRVNPDSVVVRVEITVADVERALGFGWDPENVTVEQVRSRLDSIQSYVGPRFAFSSRGTRIPMRLAGVDVRYMQIGDYVVLTYLFEDAEDLPDEVDVLYSVLFDVSADHRNMLVIEHNWKTGTFNNESNVSLVFSPRSPEQRLDLASGSVLQGFLSLVRLGVWHIWIGLDHILFLMALILPSVLVRDEGRWKPVASFREALVNIVTIVTFFTIAHSVTLSIAALDVLRLSSRLVESVIAASIAAAAWANLVPQVRVREWTLAFAFGLFHGFGFASVLGGVGLGRDFMVLSLLGFNVGVELGQLAVVCAAFPLFFLLRRSRAYMWFLRIGSWFLIAVALLWMLERTFDFNVPLRTLATAPFSWLLGALTGGA